MTYSATGSPAGLPSDTTPEPPSRGPGILLGLGLGGFVDGIVLHQILQWHHMVSDVEPVDTVAGLEVNTLADGFFHLGTWFLVVGGLVALIATWRQGRMAPSWSFQLGLLVMGWGIFNLVEGLVNHQLLGVHHVRDDLGAPLSWDLGFLASGVLLTALGWLWHRRGAAALEKTRDASPEM
ncbi:DUF2243 domain-containing protein [Nocardioides campestrisoli]|uniref:DUF2243 domain-containing protein n=1 Tax=Nocardioides campestrisoli TaxID=2736757 RepID=UPI0015E6530A|nr:DUF2243 domain-containing protein [Nocardioides campestrisoli]